MQPAHLHVFCVGFPLGSQPLHLQEQGGPFVIELHNLFRPGGTVSVFHILHVPGQVGFQGLKVDVCPKRGLFSSTSVCLAVDISCTAQRGPDSESACEYAAVIRLSASVRRREGQLHLTYLVGLLGASAAAHCHREQILRAAQELRQLCSCMRGCCSDRRRNVHTESEAWPAAGIARL